MLDAKGRSAIASLGTRPEREKPPMHVSNSYFKGTPLEAGFGAAKSAAVLRLQKALRLLASVTRDTAINVVADGLIGPKTTAAANRALTRHIGPGQAPASYRTGALPQTQVLAAAAAIARSEERRVGEECRSR